MATPIPPNRAPFTVDEIVAATKGKLVHRAKAREIIGLTTDSRAVTAGSAFVALAGETHDGHAFLDAAVKSSVGLLVVGPGRRPAFFDGLEHDDLDLLGEAERLASDGEREASDLVRALADTRAVGPASVVEVPDGLVAWGDLARAHLVKWREKAVDPRVIAITGSAGKTTTKEITAALFAVLAPTHATAGNLNNRIGVPAVVFGVTPVHRFCVLEMGMSLPGELDAITSFAKPDVAIVTNVGVAHAEGVGGREGVMHEKGAVYRALGEDGVAIVNADDEYVVKAAEITKGKRITFGRSATASYRLARRDSEGAAGSLVRIATPTRDITIRVPFPGDAFAIDLVAALAAVEAASGIELDAGQIETALGTIVLEGRATLRRLGSDVVLLDDTYNANPASMRASLATLNEIGANRRRIAVLGEMKELGDHAEAEHLALGDAIADAGVGLVIGCGGLIDLALDRAAARGVEVAKASGTDEAARITVDRARSGDAILVKASRSVGAERVVAALAKASESLPSL